MSFLSRYHVVVVCFAACTAGGGGSTDSQATTGTTSTTSVATTSGVTTTSSEPTTSGTSSTTALTSGGTAEAQCGDGSLQDDEACDDGNAINGDGCNVDCTISGVAVWTYQSNLEGDDRIYGLALGEGGAIFAGGFQMVDGQRDKWIARFEAGGGAPGWSQTHDEGPVLGLAVAASSLYAVGGTVSDADELDVWVAGLPLTGGELSWQDTYSSGFGPDYVTGVVTIPGGDAIVAGLVTPESQVGGTLWVRRYTAEGAQEWTATHPDVGRPLGTFGPGIAANAERVVIGYAHRISADLQPEMLIAYAHDGAPLWNLDLPDTNGLIYGVAHAGDGDLAVAGRADYKDFVVRRLSGDGAAEKWSSTLCLGGNGRAVAVDSQGDYVVIGDGDGEVGKNIRLCKFSPDGHLLWGQDIDGGFGDDVGHAVAITSDDFIVAGGWLATSADAADAWLAKFSP